MIKNYITQQIYYFLGIFIGLSSRVKKFLLGLKSPRPRMLALSDYQTNLNYDKEILRTIIELSGQTNIFAGKRILEVGPGPDLMLGLLALENGAASYQAIDYFPVLSAPALFYQNLAKELRRPEAVNAANFLSRLSPDSQEINAPGLSYKILGIDKIHESENKFDFIFSKDVLEHVDDLDAAFQALRLSLAPGGKMIHKIDFQTHTSFIQETDKLNFLRYSPWVYKRLVKFRGGPNRLRLPELVKLAESRGFVIDKIHINKQLTEAELVKIKPYLSKYYRNLSDDKLLPLSAWIIFH